METQNKMLLFSIQRLHLCGQQCCWRNQTPLQP